MKPELTDKQFELVLFWIRGYNYCEIAEVLGYSSRTLETRGQQLIKKFRCKNIPHLIATLYSQGYLPSSATFLE